MRQLILKIPMQQINLDNQSVIISAIPITTQYFSTEIGINPKIHIEPKRP